MTPIPLLTPDRLKNELAALAAASIATIDKTATGGTSQLACTLQYRGSDAVVDVTFTDGFPWMPPVVSSNEPILQRHQVPMQGGAFCLDRADAPWWTPEHSVAQLLQHLQRLLDADSSRTVRDTEADMSEPASAFLSGTGLPLVLLTHTPLQDHLGAREGTLTLERLDGPTARWLVTSLSANGGTVHLKPEAPPSMLHLEPRSMSRVRWIDIGTIQDRPGVEAAREELAAMTRPPAPHGRRERRPHTWRAVTFMEEGPRRGQTRRAWAFARTRGDAQEFATTQALSLAERSARRQELLGLADARVLLVGAGSVGSTIALQLAQAGVRDLQIIDADRFDINNGVRHVLPASAAGSFKAEALAAFANDHQPFCRATGQAFSIGRTPGSVTTTANLVSNSDIVVDATGSLTTSRLLGRLAQTAEIPAIHTALLSGRGHGFVFVRRPGTGCIDHFLKTPDAPFPADEPTANSTPYGCSHPAVSSAPFESAELGIHAARVCAQILPTDAYGTFDDDWLVIRPVREGAAETGRLAAVTSCPYCAS